MSDIFSGLSLAPREEDEPPPKRDPAESPQAEAIPPEKQDHDSFASRLSLSPREEESDAQLLSRPGTFSGFSLDFEPLDEVPPASAAPEESPSHPPEPMVHRSIPDTFSFHEDDTPGEPASGFSFEPNDADTPREPASGFSFEPNDALTTPKSPPDLHKADESGDAFASFAFHPDDVQSLTPPALFPFSPDDEATVVAPPSARSFQPETDDEATVVAPPSARSFQPETDDEATVVAPPSARSFQPETDDEATVVAPPSARSFQPETDDEATVVATSNVTRPTGIPTSTTRATATRAPINYGFDAPKNTSDQTALEAEGDGQTESTRAQEPINVDALPIGHMLMWYKIEKVLGQGGFGLTYKARDTRLNNHVAIKEYLPTQLAHRGTDGGIHPKGPEQEEPFIKGRERFLNEARTLARFKHPALVRVATFFEEANSAYMAMEFEEGESLGSVLKEKKTLDEPELLKVVMPLLQGLQALHAENIIHRDIKPDNIFIRKKDGTPVLLDFGSARKTDAGDNMTAMLTPSYAPMEQYFEDASRQGPWTDIYAMGAVMYRIISG
ncbi:MAG: protein kinase, partial [Magnetococcales bacterium]|nr:protein kinase [Magnetococcales bacterium]